MRSSTLNRFARMPLASLAVVVLLRASTAVAEVPGALGTVPVPKPNLAGFVRDEAAAVALGSDQAGRYVLVVNGENVVEQRKVQTGPLEGDLRVIESGLKADDRIVIAGLLRAIPGQKVDPQLQKIEPSGKAAAK